MVTATSSLSAQDVGALRTLLEEHWTAASLARDRDTLLGFYAPDMGSPHGRHVLIERHSL